jgi:hypothetical protein
MFYPGNCSCITRIHAIRGGKRRLSGRLFIRLQIKGYWASILVLLICNFLLSSPQWRGSIVYSQAILLTPWIPAFAGMTVVDQGIALKLTFDER